MSSHPSEAPVLGKHLCWYFPSAFNGLQSLISKSQNLSVYPCSKTDGAALATSYIEMH